MVIIAYTDGACSGNGTKKAIGGIGVHFPGQEYKDISVKYTEEQFPYGTATNNICELLGIKIALETVDMTQDLVIYSDSMYSINTLLTWAPSWIKKGIFNSKKNPALIASILTLMNARSSQLNIIHVDGHCKCNGLKSSVAGHEFCKGNYEADTLAVNAKSL